MAMPTSAPAIVNIFGITNEMILTTNPTVDSTTAASQAQLFPVKRPYATTNDAIHRISIASGMNDVPNTVKIDPLPCANAVSNAIIPPS
jgi:hypothetical protein